jgi:uncharacterized protein
MVWFLLAHGAGAGSTSQWMQKWARLLGEIGSVETFDYRYQAAGKKRPDPLPQLVETHASALRAGQTLHGDEVVLVGKSMGGRVGCHLALIEPVLGNVCLGYPLVSPSGRGPLRDQVLLELERPVCFIQGTRDPLCPLPELDKVIAKRHAPSVLHVVSGGDHSLAVTKTQLARDGQTQEMLERQCLAVIANFCAGL